MMDRKIYQTHTDGQIKNLSDTTDGQKNLSDTQMDRKTYQTHRWTEKSIKHTVGQKNLSNKLMDSKIH